LRFIANSGPTASSKFYFRFSKRVLISSSERGWDVAPFSNSNICFGSKSAWVAQWRSGNVCCPRPGILCVNVFEPYVKPFSIFFFQFLALFLLSLIFTIIYFVPKLYLQDIRARPPAPVKESRTCKFKLRVWQSSHFFYFLRRQDIQ